MILSNVCIDVNSLLQLVYKDNNNLRRAIEGFENPLNYIFSLFFYDECTQTHVRLSDRQKYCNFMSLFSGLQHPYHSCYTKMKRHIACLGTFSCPEMFINNSMVNLRDQSLGVIHILNIQSVEGAVPL